LAWIFLPFWLFFLISLYLYFVPIFRSGKLAVPFFILLILSYLQPTGWIFGIIFGIVFYLTLLIKGLLLIDRRSAYEFLVLALSFLLVRDFYLRFAMGIGGTALLFSFIVAAAFALLLNSFVRCFREEVTESEGVARAAIWLSFLIFWQIMIAGLFLPADFIYQSVIVFLIAVLLTDLIPEYLFGGLSRAKILTATTVTFGLFVIVLGSGRWGL
jgi:hypothetical protein